MTQTEALKMALEAAYLAGFNASGEGYNGEYPFDQVVNTPVENHVWKKDRDNYIKEALEQQSTEQVEPVAWYDTEEYGNIRWASEWSLDEGTPLYTHPPVPTAQPKQEKNFCQRCGKQLGKNDWDIHTCTPPQPKELEQEPVVVMELYTDGWDLVEGIDTDWLESLPFGTKLYTTPPQRTWVGLTEEEFFAIWNNSNLGPIGIKTAIEAKLKEKNTRNGGCL